LGLAACQEAGQASVLRGAGALFARPEFAFGKIDIVAVRPGKKRIEILIASGAAEFGSLAWKMREGSRSRPLAPRVLVRVCSVHPPPNSSAFYMHR
jgi:hypothetical protein